MFIAFGSYLVYLFLQFHSFAAKTGLECTGGHYPGAFCHGRNVYLNHTSKTFVVDAENDDEELPREGDTTFQVFPVETRRLDTIPRCDRVVEEAYFFTFYYYYGHSNYYHLHYDTLLPVYFALKHGTPEERSDSGQHRITLMPSVETSRLNVMNWVTDAFSEKHQNKYFVLMHQALAGDEFDLVPADSRFIEINPSGFTCFRKIHFGAPRIRYPDEDTVPNFVEFIRNRVGLTRPYVRPTSPKVGIIKRSNRRRILNEEELIAAIQPFVEAELVNFDGRTFAEQVSMMLEYTVLVGVNGAGLMNGIYLGEGAVTIQLVPFNATQLNVREFGNILKSRGPYLEWWNKHEELNRGNLERDPYNSQADTEVHVDEFAQLIRDALKIGINRKLRKEEL